MQQNNNPFPNRGNFMSSSSMFYQNHQYNSPQNAANTYLAAKNNQHLDAQIKDNYALNTNQISFGRSMITQSMIIPGNSQSNSGGNKFGLGKLTSMARQVNANQDYFMGKVPKPLEVPINKQMQTGNFPGQTGLNAGQSFNKNINNFNKVNQLKKIHTEPSQHTDFRRRETIEPHNHQPENNHQKIENNLKFLNRRQIDLQKYTQKEGNNQKLVDCQSTNSGSGNQIKSKNFDFLKKRNKELTNDTASTHSMKNLQLPFSAKKPQTIWPLSISPMDQKMEQFKFSLESPAKQTLTARNEQLPASPIEFRKKKTAQSGQITNTNSLSTLTISSNIGNNVNSNTLNANNGNSINGSNGNNTNAITNNINNTTPTNSGNKFLTVPGLSSDSPITTRERRATRFQRMITVNDFQFMEKLGKGAFGDVFMAQQKNIGFICVIKKISKRKIKEMKVQEHIMRQIKLQCYLNHCHLTSFYGCFDDQENVYMIIELLPDGSLQQIKKKKKLPEHQVASIIRQVAEGLRHMHDYEVIHRDLKPQNLFLNEGYVKIGDFGCAIYNDSGLRNTIVGCLEYSSPEQLCKTYYTDKIDIWSLGVLTYELLIGKSPFQKDIVKIARNQIKPQLSGLAFPESVPLLDVTVDFIRKMLMQNPDDRMDIDQILSHPFLKLQKAQGKLSL